MSDTLFNLVLLVGSILMIWGVVGIFLFMTDDVVAWLQRHSINVWGVPHSIRWLPGGWE